MNTLATTTSQRAADALLQTSGRTVILRLPGPAASNNIAEELGLADPLFQDVALAPCVFRKSSSTTELLVSATAIATLTSTTGAADAQTLFAQAIAILIDNESFTITQATAQQTSATPYTYTLKLQRQ